MEVAILDYDMANLRSVQKAIEEVGHSARIISTPQEVLAAEKLVLPGVGAFKDAIGTLRSRGLAGPILAHVAADRPFLGICLGLQLLFERGYEDGVHEGLGVLKGECVRFEVDKTAKLKVPHMGWNQLNFKTASPLFKGVADGANVYFVHSYFVAPGDSSIVAATTDYGGAFVSSVRRGNLFATQFHPEKSQSVGLQILKNFAEL